MEKVLLIRLGELTVKSGKTRVEMEKLLLRAAREASGECGGAKLAWEPGRFYAWGDLDCLKKTLSHIFGIKSLSPSLMMRFENIQEVVQAAVAIWGGEVKGKKFAVRVHRVGRHSFKSIDLAAAVGAALVAEGGLVDLENPEVEFYIEVRGRRAYLYREIIEGPGGLPLGSEGKVLALVSGGIDSPVAAWLSMRRGAHVDVFYCNLGGTWALKQALLVIKALLKWSYGYNAKVIYSDCAPVARAIRQKVREELWNIAFKRALYLTAVRLAERVKAAAIVTGESLGQVSSQTIQAIAAAERGIDLPILRPLIGLDKDEIVAMAKKIGTYDLSASMSEYCAIFSKRPRKWALRWEVEEIDLAIHDAVEEVVRNAVVLRKTELPRHLESLTPPPDLEIESPPPGSVVVDLRDEKAYRKWRLPGAVRVDPDKVLEFVEQTGGKVYVFYCHSGSLSREVAESLRKLGVRAYSLRLWRTSSHSLQRDTTSHN
ncbi:MAG: tRNA uracil 4-sulfurtransferase ThiI [Pyrobaculum sp.]